MSRTKNNRAAPISAVVIDANPAFFSRGTTNRADRLVETLKPITDTWFPCFYKAAKEGSDAVIVAWYDYRHEYFYAVKPTEDEVFRFAALLTILRSIETESYVHENGITGIVREIASLIADKVMTMAKNRYPRKNYPNEMAVVELANDIDTLGQEYPNVR